MTRLRNILDYVRAFQFLVEWARLASTRLLCRRRAAALTKNSIQVAAEYGARFVVLHPGQTGASPEIEARLKQLSAQGQINAPEADALRAPASRAD